VDASADRSAVRIPRIKRVWRIATPIDVHITTFTVTRLPAGRVCACVVTELTAFGGEGRLVRPGPQQVRN
jgi:hypothetical protein